MGIDLDTWRSRIGTHISYLRKKSVNSYLFTSKWIKFDVKKYLLLCSILLVLCGDVEENPGPPLNFPIRGKIHQGDEIFSVDSRGRQCVSCCLSFFLNVMIKPLNSKTWCSDDLDTVLYIGDYIYRHSKKHMKHHEEY